MIVPLSQIPPHGLRISSRVPMNGMNRLLELAGTQTGDLAVDVMLKNRSGHVEVTGTLNAALRIACNRCLDPVEVDIEESIRIHLAPEQSAKQGGIEIQLAAADLEVSFYSGEEINLGAVLEDELILLIPSSTCEEDDDGRCAVCGRRATDVMPSAPPDEAGHPLAGLRDLVRGKKK